MYTSNIKSVIDVGMDDAMAAGAWPEKENPNTTRINEIIDYVKQVYIFYWPSACRDSADPGFYNIQSILNGNDF